MKQPEYIATCVFLRNTAAIFQAFDEMLKGVNIADVVAIMASLNIIAGELDR